MDQTRAFLSRVLPWDGAGYNVVAWHRPGKPFRGRSVTTVNEMVESSQTLLNTTKSNLYYCLSRQSVNGGTRTQENALALKSIFCELDVEAGNPKRYETIEAALSALSAFVHATKDKLPPPSAIVRSGGGAHVYWFSDRPLSVEEWLPYANGLRALYLAHDLRGDAGIITDAARVLRIPGTKNFKTDPAKPVKVLRLVDNDYTFSTDLADIRTTAVAQPKGQASLGKLASAFASVPVEGFDVIEPLVLDNDAIFAGCPWLRTALETGGKDYDQPQWNLTTLCATFMENGHDLAHRMGNQHPGYSAGSTDKLWERKDRERDAKGLGWPQCRSIQASGSTACGSCPHLLREKSPLNLGIPGAAHAGSGAIAARAGNGAAPSGLHVGHNEAGAGEGDGGDCGPTPIEELQHLPEGYRLDAQGRVNKVTTVMDKNTGDPKDIWKLLFRCRLSDFIHVTPMGISMTVSLDKGREKRVTLPLDELVPAKILTTLAGREILVNGEAEPKQLNGFFMSFLEKLNAAAAAQEATSFGWWFNGGSRAGFIYGGKAYSEDGTVASASLSDPGLHKWYMPTGSKDAWLKAAELTTRQRRPELDLILAIPFAAPIMAFTGESGALISAWGPPGTTKSSTSKVAAAVWGHPIQTRESLGSTENSVLNRIGKIKNLPVYWDDIQKPEAQKHLYTTGFVSTQGVEKGRLRSDITAQGRGMWKTLLLACSNMSFVDYLVKEQSQTSAAVLRVFEYFIPVKEDDMIDDTDAGRIIENLERNYGMVGAEYAALLATRHGEIEQYFVEANARFKKRVKGQKDERYWSVVCGALLTGASYARELGVDIDLDALEEFLVATYQENRRRLFNEEIEGGSAKNTQSVLGAFLKEYIGKGHALVTNTAPLVRGAPPAVSILRQPLPGRPLHIHFITEAKVLRISKREFKSFVDQQKSGSSAVLSGLEKHLGMQTIRVSLGGGTEYRTMKEWALEFPIAPGSDLAFLMDAWPTQEVSDEAQG